MLFDSSYSYFLALDVEEDVDVLSLSITLDAQMPLVSRVGHSLFQFIANTYISLKRMLYMDSRILIANIVYPTVLLKYQCLSKLSNMNLQCSYL